LKKSKKELIEAIKTVFVDLRHDKDKLNEINTILINYNVKIGILNELIVKESLFDDLDLTILCLMTISIYEVIKKEMVNPDKFFNQPEIDKAKQYTGEETFIIKFPIVIENVIKVGSSDKDFSTVLSIQQITEWNNSKLLNYNYETQRTAKQTLRHGEIIKRPEVNYHSVQQISELMIKGEYKPDKIAFNILFDGNDEISYDEKNKTLTIYNCTQIDILDGFHRILGATNALDTKSDIDLSLEVAIKNYTIQEAKKFFGQINTVNKVSAPRLKQLKNERISDQIVTELEKTEEFKNRITGKASISNKIGELTNFSILSDAIDQIFQPKTRKELLDLVPFFTDFFGYMFGTYPEAFKTKISEIKTSSWINHHNLFVGYVVLAKKFFDQSISVNKISEVMIGIDFSKDTSDLSEIMRSQGKENSKRVKARLVEYFNKIEV
jgi:hypothetical protein